MFGKWGVLIGTLSFVTAVGAPAMAIGAAKADPPVRARALTPLPGLFSTEDYPMAALRNDDQGTTAISLSVGRDGRVSACSVTASSGSAALDATTCSVLQRRGRFAPARDASGRAVEDQSSARIKWQLPALEFADRHERLILALNKSGAAPTCILEGTNDRPPAPESCEMAKEMLAKMLSGGEKAAEFGDAQLVLESGLRVGGPETIVKVGRGEGETLGAMFALAVEIDPTGKVLHCDSADGFERVRDLDRGCAHPQRLGFEPSATNEPRRAVIYEAVYLRSKH